MSQVTRYHEFAGGRNDYSKCTMPLTQKPGQYWINGTGRDTYIYNDNGNNAVMHEPTKQPIRGTMNFG